MNAKRNISKYKRNIPWLLSSDCQKSADAAHNCILVPSGMKQDFCSKNVFTKPGLLKGHDKIQFVMSFINFSLSFTKLPREYKNLMGLISNNIAAIASPVLPLSMVVDRLNKPTGISHLDDLFLRATEMCSLLEAMIPDSEQMFTTHQIVDVVAGLQQFGPIRGWWAYPIERLMSSIKCHCPSGGVNPVKTLTTYCYLNEDTKRSHHVPNSKHLDNLGRYRDNCIKLIGKPQPLPKKKWNVWLCEHLFTSVFITFENLKTANYELLSPFYRIYTVYSNSKKQLRKYLTKYCVGEPKATFCNWLELVMNVGETDLFSRVCEDDVSKMDIDIMQKYLSERVLFSGDFETLQELYSYTASGPKEFYTQAIVKGVLFKQRGIMCCETEAPIDSDFAYGTENENFLPFNSMNILKKHWHEKVHYSSWCKFLHWTKNPRTKLITSKMKYGQMNYSFRLNLQSDTLLHGLGFANVTAHNTQQVSSTSKIKYPYINCSDRTNSSYDKNCQFICLNYIASTNVAVCGIREYKSHKGIVEKLPILAHSKARKTHIEVGAKFFCLDVKQMNQLALIDMHTSRKYVNISFDDSKLTESLTKEKKPNNVDNTRLINVVC